MSGDTELLRRYVEERSEVAFAELVRLHVRLVYYAALRQVGGDVHRAQDVSQVVFTDLARKAPSLTNRATLTGWLHTSTRFAAAMVRRADLSREKLKRESETMREILQEPASDVEWERLRPLVDEVLHDLNDRDRDAVLMRFFEGLSFASIGATFALSEDAARMRVDRALDKLRDALARRGVKSTSAALATVFATQAGVTAPASLAGAITSAALAGVAADGLAAVGTGILMSSTATAILSAVALAAISTTAYQWNRAFRAESELAALTADRNSLRVQLRAEQDRAARSAQDVASPPAKREALETKRTAPPADQDPVVTVNDSAGETRVRSGILANLKQIEASRERFLLEKGRLPTSVYDMVGPDNYIHRLVSVGGEDYSVLPMVAGQPWVIKSPDGITVTYHVAERDAAEVQAAMRGVELVKKAKAASAFQKAFAAYQAANNGQRPANAEALIPFFATPQEGADFVEFLEAQKAARGN